MKTIAKAVLRLLFGCLHEQQTWVLCDEEGLYRRCTGCGRRFAYTAVKFVPVAVRKRA